MNNIIKQLILVLALGLVYSCGNDTNSPEPPETVNPGGGGTKKSFVVMSYNVKHCSPYYGVSGEDTTPNPYNVAQVIKKFSPDVVFLQEIDSCNTRSGISVDQSKELAKLAGYPYYSFFKIMDYRSGKYGLALLSKYPLNDCVSQKIPDAIDGVTLKNNALGTANITYNGKNITLAVTHLSTIQTERDKQLPFILDNILSKYKGTVIFAGDFNARPDNNTIMQLTAGGFTRTNKNPANFTIPSNNPNREIDYISYRPATAFNVKSHIVLTGINASDHLPIISSLEIQ
ncbi:MAG: endonuclease/exonuclease/phosphatase family protein [Muribaculaceae bacterium]|nr:endonuclease/exonuclease/phosphatase family protein [Muribaculaceae bacterium]